MKTRLVLALSFISAPAVAADVTFTPTGWIETRLATDFDSLTSTCPRPPSVGPS